MNNKLRGVNIGGWLLAEHWITPSLFGDAEGRDEATIRSTRCDVEINDFRRSFVTEADIKYIAECDISLLRVPISYFDIADRHATVALKHLDWCMEQAAEHNLKVLIDLHAARGSQNGQDHSGREGNIEWHQKHNIEQTIHDLKFIAERYGRHPALYGIELLNEPSKQIPAKTLVDFYIATYHVLDPLLHKNAVIVCSDSFRPWHFLLRLNQKKYPRLVLDHHHYQLFGSIDRFLPAKAQLLRAKYVLPIKLWLMLRKHRTIVGEWSGVLRADKLSEYSPKKRDTIQQAYARIQQKAFERAGIPHFYWTYKTEGKGLWNFSEHAQELNSNG